MWQLLTRSSRFAMFVEYTSSRSSYRGYRTSKTIACIPTVSRDTYRTISSHKKCPRALFTDLSLLSKTTDCKPTEIIFTIFQNRRYTFHDGTQRDEGKREKTETAKLHFAPIHRHDLSMVLLASRDRSPVSIDARDHLMDLLTRENHNADETERDTTSVISVGIYRARMRNV